MEWDLPCKGGCHQPPNPRAPKVPAEALTAVGRFDVLGRTAMSTSAPVPVAVSTSASTTVAGSRLVSIDALRGFDMFWILGADAVLRALARAWDIAPFRFLKDQMDHAEWAGFRFYDLIFPLFVFIVGVSLVFSLTRVVAQHGRIGALKRILPRAALLFLFGIFYNGGLANPWPNVRLPGVLQHIALAYALAGLMFVFLRPRVIAAAGVALLLGYWALLALVPIRDFQLERKALAARFGVERPPMEQVQQAFYATDERVTGRFDPGLNVANHFDFQYLPGRKYDVYWDPEGVLDAVGALGSCLLGVFAGLLLRRTDKTERQKIALLAIGGVTALAVGWLWSWQLPVVKKIWTSSFVLVAGGWSLLLLAAFYYVVDVRQWRGWCRPFVWIGMNAITLYLATSVVSFDRISQRFVGGSVKLFFETQLGKGAGDVVIAAGALGLLLLLARFLHQRKIFLKV